MFTPHDIENVMTKMAAEDPPPRRIQVELLPLSKSEKNDKRRTPLHLQINDIIRIHSLLESDIDVDDCTKRKLNQRIADAVDDLEGLLLKNRTSISSILEVQQFIHHLQTEGMTEEEKRLPRLSWAGLK